MICSFDVGYQIPGVIIAVPSLYYQFEAYVEKQIERVYEVKYEQESFDVVTPWAIETAARQHKKIFFW